MTNDLNSNDNSNTNIDKSDERNNDQKKVEKSGSQDHSSPKNDKSKLKKSTRLKFPKFNTPKLGLPKFKLPRPKVSFPKINFLWVGLLIILVSYICIGYFLSVLMTIASHKNLAIAGLIIMGLLPTVTGLADYELMKWGYLLSGFLIVGGLIFFLKLKFYLIVLALISWISITAIAFIGESLLKQKYKLTSAILILTTTCLIGLGLGWKLWDLAATLLS